MAWFVLMLEMFRNFSRYCAVLNIITTLNISFQEGQTKSGLLNFFYTAEWKQYQ